MSYLSPTSTLGHLGVWYWSFDIRVKGLLLDPYLRVEVVDGVERSLI